MVLCGYCDKWQHAVCFGLLHESQVPQLHVCEQCAKVCHHGGLPVSDGSWQVKGEPCTDPSLSVEEVRSVCLWRRALSVCSERSRIQITGLVKRLG